MSLHVPVVIEIKNMYFFIQAAISETIQKLIDSKQTAELNPTKMDSPDDACNNAEFLLMILDQVKIIKNEYYIHTLLIDGFLPLSSHIVTLRYFGGIASAMTTGRLKTSSTFFFKQSCILYFRTPHDNQFVERFVLQGRVKSTVCLGLTLGGLLKESSRMASIKERQRAS